jgi:hypothetical protein
MDDIIGILWSLLLAGIPVIISFAVMRKLRGVIRIIVLGLIMGFPAVLLAVFIDQFFVHPAPGMLASPDAGSYLILGVMMMGFIIVLEIIGIIIAVIVGHMARKKAAQNPEALS